MKRIVISDESINSHGFWVVTSGIELEAFLRNPVMLWNHNRDAHGTVDAQLPIGTWKDLRIENDPSTGSGAVLTGEPVFDENDEFALKIKQKYEAGILNACSMGFMPLEWSDAPEMLKQGQKVATVTRCRLLEVSICDIPANANATVVLYDENSKTINLSALPGLRDWGTAATIRTNNQHLNNNNDMTLQEIALKMGMEASATAEAIAAAITDLKSENTAYEATLQNLEQENRQLKAKLEGFEQARSEARKAEADSLLDEAVRSGRIEATARPQMEKLFGLDHEAAKAALAALPERKPMETRNTGDDLTKLGWDELDRSNRLAELKTKHPDLFRQKFIEKFGCEPTME